MSTPAELRSLVTRAGALRPVDAVAAAEMGHHRARLVAEIDRQIFARPDLAGLRLRTPRELLENNHRNHVALIHNVAALNAFELLARSLPWVYATYEARGLTPAYFLAVVEAGRVALRTALSPQACAEIEPLYDLILQAHPLTLELSKGPAAVLGGHPGPLAEPAERVLQLLLQGKQRELLCWVGEQAADTPGLTKLYLDVITPVMERVGALWQQGRLSVADEHLATSLVGLAMAQIYARLPPTEVVPGKVAVVACGPGETHELAGRMFAALLEARGWDVSYLGAGVPPAELLTHLERRKPLLLALSVTMAFNLGATADVLHELRGEPAWERLRVLLGGRGLDPEPALAHRMGADGWADSLVAGVEWSEQWWREREAEEAG